VSECALDNRIEKKQQQFTEEGRKQMQCLLMIQASTMALKQHDDDDVTPLPLYT
jgi:hypothetical protein